MKDEHSLHLMHREKIKKARRWVVKIGSAMLTDHGKGLNHALIDSWARQIVALREKGQEVVLVSSGAVAEGMARLNWNERPTAVHQLQAVAAVGQMGLIQAYADSFSRHGVHTAQVLLTHDDLSNRQRYLNARSSLRTLLDLGIVPIVNENDTVATDEIRFGDNDSLAGLTANLIEADVLVLLTDQDGFYEADPNTDPDAVMVKAMPANAEPLLQMAQSGGVGRLGRGGMVTKVRAARHAARSGANTIIAYGAEPDILIRLLQGEPLGTLLYATETPVVARKRWLAGHLQVRGVLHLDDGAVRALTQARKSLLPIGITGVRGNFNRGELVACCNSQGTEVARGLVNYDARDLEKIIGQPSHRIGEILGYVDEDEAIHRDNLILL